MLRGVVLEEWVCAMNELETTRRPNSARARWRPDKASAGFPDSFDEELWRNLEETGLSRLTATEDAGPAKRPSC